MQGQENVINSGDDIVLNNLKYDDAKTQINAKGYVTTENVTGEDLSAKGGSFPQSVSADIQPSCDPAPEVDPIYSDEDSFSGQIGQIGMQEPATIEKAGIEETVSERFARSFFDFPEAAVVTTASCLKSSSIFCSWVAIIDSKSSWRVSSGMTKSGATKLQSP